MDGWHKSRGRVINGANHWNLYAKYYAKHEAQERKRLDISSDVLGKSSQISFYIISVLKLIESHLNDPRTTI